MFAVRVTDPQTESGVKQLKAVIAKKTKKKQKKYTKKNKKKPNTLGQPGEMTKEV